MVINVFFDTMMGMYLATGMYLANDDSLFFFMQVGCTNSINFDLGIDLSYKDQIDDESHRSTANENQQGNNT